MHRSIACLALILLAPLASGADFTGSWSAVPDRTWAGPDYWANRLQDWRVADGRLECIEARAGKPMRAVHLLTHSLSSSSGSLRMSVRTGVIEGAGNTSPEAATGFLVGAGGREMDYRSAALIHHNPGPGAGLFCGVDSRGRAFIRDFERKPQPGEPGPAPGRTLSDAELRFSAQPSGKTYTLTIAAHDPESGAVLSQASLDGVDPERLIGNVALVSHPATGKSTGRFWFNDWAVSGSKVRAHPDHVCGPVLCTQYTVHEGVLKLTAQMMPLGIDDAQAVELQVRDGDAWETVARTDIIRSGFTAPFRVEGWDPGRDARYRVVHDLGTYEGTIRRDPIGKDSIVVAAFTGNHNCARGIDGKGPYSWRNGIWFPHADIVGNVGIHDPDLLFFSGDQIYEGASPTGTERKPIERAELDYLYKWYLWCWAFRDLTRDRPTVTMPDDHDVYQGNIWGMGGARGDANKGGYSMPPEWLRTVERTQTSHLPDPFDPTPIQQGLGVYYTDLTVGGVGFAILEDRKFKSSPTLITAEKTPDNHITEEEFDGRDADVPGAELLGERQLLFLREFARDWRGQEMKAVLSQTIFANLQTRDRYPDKLDRDLDSNGWPQSGRARALDEMRRGFMLHIAGDQHLGSVIHHGIDEWEDAGWSFCVPSIANFYLRFWNPPARGGNHQPGMPDYTGRYLDGFGNRLTVHAVSNPTPKPGPGQFPDPVQLHGKAPGYGIVRFDKRAREMTLECWPRYAHPKRDRPYRGWPITVSQLDQYGRKPYGHLPLIDYHAAPNSVIQVTNEATGEMVYTIRPHGRGFMPWVFEDGVYTVKTGEGASASAAEGLRPIKVTR